MSPLGLAGYRLNSSNLFREISPSFVDLENQNFLHTASLKQSGKKLMPTANHRRALKQVKQRRGEKESFDLKRLQISVCFVKVVFLTFLVRNKGEQ